MREHILNVLLHSNPQPPTRWLFMIYRLLALVLIHILLHSTPSFAAPCDPTGAVCMGQECDRIGTTTMDFGKSNVIACVNTSLGMRWARMTTDNIYCPAGSVMKGLDKGFPSCEAVPNCTASGSVLTFNGSTFSCTTGGSSGSLSCAAGTFMTGFSNGVPTCTSIPNCSASGKVLTYDGSSFKCADASNGTYQILAGGRLNPPPGSKLMPKCDHLWGGASCTYVSTASIKVSCPSGKAVFPMARSDGYYTRADGTSTTFYCIKYTT